MTFNLARVVVDAQIEYYDAAKGKLAVYDKPLDLTLCFNRILAMKAFVTRTVIISSPPKQEKTMPHDNNPAKKAVIKMSNTKQVSKHTIFTSRRFCLHIVNLEQRSSRSLMRSIRTSLVWLLARMHLDVIV